MMNKPRFKRKPIKKHKPSPEKLQYFIINKPYGTICQFTPEGNHQTLKDLYPFPNDVYSVGRLDTDSEGLLIITNDNFLKTRLTEPKFEHKRTYWVQVDGDIKEDAIQTLRNGVEIAIKGKTYLTKRADCELLDQQTTSNIEERDPPIRVRKNIPAPWISLTLTEGKNRQVRRMTAKVNFPTLRLIRYSIENLNLEDLEGQQIKEVGKEWIYKKVGLKQRI